MYKRRLRLIFGWVVEATGPAGRAHFAWGGHFVTCVPCSVARSGIGPPVGRDSLRYRHSTYIDGTAVLESAGRIFSTTSVLGASVT